MPAHQATLSKTKRVEAMFNGIAHRYDFLNHFLSLGIDRIWRGRVVKCIITANPQHVLDVATGTADLAIALAQANSHVVVTGIDTSEGMLAVGADKINKLQLGRRIGLKHGNSLNMEFETNTFDAVMVAFGVRNFEDVNKGLGEMLRVLKSNGKVFILEFSKPSMFPMKQLYFFYFRYVLPAVGRLLSGHSSAYTYLPESVNAFPDGENFTELMRSCGFTNCAAQRFTFGVATLYEGTKPAS